MWLYKNVPAEVTGLFFQRTKFNASNGFTTQSSVIFQKVLLKQKTVKTKSQNLSTALISRNISLVKIITLLWLRNVG